MLKRAQDDCGLSGKEICRRADVPYSSFLKFLSGHRVPSLHQLDALLDACDHRLYSHKNMGDIDHVNDLLNIMKNCFNTMFKGKLSDMPSTPVLHDIFMSMARNFSWGSYKREKVIPNNKELHEIEKTIANKKRYKVK